MPSTLDSGARIARSPIVRIPHEIERAPLAPADPGHQGQMVVGPPSRAMHSPNQSQTLQWSTGSGYVGEGRGDGLLEAKAYPAKVRLEP